MNLVLDSERLETRAASLAVAVPALYNGFRVGYVSLENADPPAFAWLDVEFHNTNGLAPLPAIADFKIEGGVRHGLPRAAVIDVQPGAAADVLRLKIAPVGDYSTYTLTTVDGAALLLDPLLARLPFKFRPGCFNLSCAPPAEAVRVHEAPAIDYLARDYDSFRHVLMAAMGARVPGWKPTSEADLDQVLIDLIAARGDELADAHDRVMSERALGTARKRVSLARHARLVDYHIHQGNQASTQVVVQVAAQTDLPIPTATRWGWIVFSGASWSDPDSTLFALVQRAGRWRRRVFPELSDLRLYTWGDTVTALAEGATSADLIDGTVTTKLSAEGLRDLFLGVDAAQTGAPADVDASVDRLVIQEMLNPATGTPNGRNIGRRKLLRLLPISADPLAPKRAEAVHDPVADRWFCRVHWMEEDTLDANYCFLARCPGLVRDVSQFFGNIVDVAHGRPRQTTFVAEGQSHPPEPPESPPFALHRAYWTQRMGQSGGGMVPAGTQAVLPNDPSIGPLAYRATQPGGEQEARSTLAVTLDGFSGYWAERIDLIESNGEEEHYVVETDELQSSLLRFGDGDNGAPVPRNAVITCRYQTGQGSAGNIGADTLTSSDPPVGGVWNPFDVTDGRDPETRDDILRRAPELYRVRQRRAVTLEDYAREAEDVPGVAHARARYAWCGSWRAVQVVIDPAGGVDLTPALAARVSRRLDAVRLIGDDIEIRPAAYVPLDIKVVVCAHPAYWIEDLRVELERAFSYGQTADGRPAFFNPDVWTFGQSLHVSQVAGRALSVQGVERAVRVSMRRFNPGAGGGLVVVEIAPGDLPESLVETLEIGAFEILVVANDPDRLERGRIAFEIRGGRR